MPRYDYKCTVCGHPTEIEHSMFWEEELECGECYGPLKRVISNPAGTHFKGQGWGKVYRKK